MPDEIARSPALDLAYRSENDLRHVTGSPTGGASRSKWYRICSDSRGATRRRSADCSPSGELARVSWCRTRCDTSTRSSAVPPRKATTKKATAQKTTTTKAVKLRALAGRPRRGRRAADRAHERGACYHGPLGKAPPHLPYRRAALSLMRWQLRRGVRRPSGSPRWRAVNERIIRDVRGGGPQRDPYRSDFVARSVQSSATSTTTRSSSGTRRV
jgi:hypothetical protein